MNDLYSMIFKRRSMRRFPENLSITTNELEEINKEINDVTPLVKGIKVKFEIVERNETTAKRGEYCLLMYSERKTSYLLNAGYMLEQLDLYLASKNIGVCWYALAKPQRDKVNDLDYVIMLAFGKSCSSDFRKTKSDFKRKNIDVIWKGDYYQDIIESVRHAPSACNTQPWRFITNEKGINVYRFKHIKSFIPKSKLPYYNSIDMGICLCFLELSLNKNGYHFKRTIFDNDGEEDLNKIASYHLL